MRNLVTGLLVTTAAAAALGSVALAQGASDKVTLNLTINQPTLFDRTKRDTFNGFVDDNTGKTTLTLTCSAAAGGTLGFGAVDETCSVAGNGTIKNPNNPAQAVRRIDYSGGYAIETSKDGYTNATTIKANYVRVGTAPAEATSFKGNVVMMPEKPSDSAVALWNQVAKSVTSKLSQAEAVKIDTKFDSIRFENFTIPNVGQQGGVSCSWTGDLIYPYVNTTWQASLDAVCGAKHYKLEGSLPLGDAPAGSPHQEEFTVNLLIAGSGGDPFATPDPFAKVDGISGVLKLKESGRVKQSGEEKNYETVVVDGELTGTNVPLEVVRGFGEITIIFARTFYGE